MLNARSKGFCDPSYLEAPSQELVLHFQEVAFIRLRLERLVDDGELGIILDVLPPSVAVTGAEVKGHVNNTLGIRQ